MAISALNVEEYRQSTPVEPTQKNKTNLLFFFLVLGLAIVKDIVDLVSHGLTAVGMGLTVTVLGSIVGIPLVVISWIVSFIIGLFVNFTIAAYFFSTGQGVARRLAIQSIGFIMEMVPFVSLLPLTTATFVIAHLIGKAPSPIHKAIEFAHIPK